MDAINNFFSENKIPIILAVVGMIAIVAIFMFRNSNKHVETPVPTPSHDLEGMDNLNMVCDLANGVCHPQNITPEQEQQAMESSVPVEHTEQ